MRVIRASDIAESLGLAEDDIILALEDRPEAPDKPPRTVLMSRKDNGRWGVLLDFEPSSDGEGYELVSANETILSRVKGKD